MQLILSFRSYCLRPVWNFLISKVAPHCTNEILEHFALTTLFMRPNERSIDDVRYFLAVLAWMDSKWFTRFSKTCRVHVRRKIVLEFQFQRFLEVGVAIRNQISCRCGFKLLLGLR